MHFRPRKSTYKWSGVKWSGVQWPQPLYYDTYPNAQWSHPQHYYELYAAGPPGGNPYPAQLREAMTVASPRQSYTSLDAELHRLLGGRRGSAAIWNVAQSPSTARRISPRGRLEPIPAVLLEQPATRPSAREMLVMCGSFSWDTDIRVPFRETKKVVNVRNVLECIHMCLQEPVEKFEWQDKSPALQKKIYGAMCERVRNAPPSIQGDGHILRIDCLLGKTAFKGLKRVGRSGKEWSLLLGHQRS